MFMYRVFSNFIHLEELHLTNAFTEQIVSQWYLLNLQGHCLFYRPPMMMRVRY